MVGAGNTLISPGETGVESPRIASFFPKDLLNNVNDPARGDSSKPAATLGGDGCRSVSSATDELSRRMKARLVEVLRASKQGARSHAHNMAAGIMPVTGSFRDGERSGGAGWAATDERRPLEGRTLMREGEVAAAEVHASMASRLKAAWDERVKRAKLQNHDVRPLESAQEPRAHSLQPAAAAISRGNSLRMRDVLSHLKSALTAEEGSGPYNTGSPAVDGWLQQLQQQQHIQQREQPFPPQRYSPQGTLRPPVHQRPYDLATSGPPFKMLEGLTRQKMMDRLRGEGRLHDGVKEPALASPRDPEEVRNGSGFTPDNRHMVICDGGGGGGSGGGEGRQDGPNRGACISPLPGERGERVARGASLSSGAVGGGGGASGASGGATPERAHSRRPNKANQRWPDWSEDDVKDYLRVRHSCKCVIHTSCGDDNAPFSCPHISPHFTPTPSHQGCGYPIHSITMAVNHVLAAGGLRSSQAAVRCHSGLEQGRDTG